MVTIAVIKLPTLVWFLILFTAQALRAASHIVELAIDTLRRELPPAPAPLDTPAGLTVPLSKATLEGKRKTRRRGGPMAEEESVV